MFSGRIHLAQNGVIAFEIRNPAIDLQAPWDKDAAHTLGEQTIYQSRRVSKREVDRISFETCFKFPDKELMSFSECVSFRGPRSKSGYLNVV